VKSAWASKINWTRGFAGAGVLLAMFGVDFDAQTQADILAGIVGVQSARDVVHADIHERERDDVQPEAVMRSIFINAARR
jgi:hypothetical protein